MASLSATVFPFRRLAVWLGVLVLGVGALALGVSALLVLPSLERNLIANRRTAVRTTALTLRGGFERSLPSQRYVLREWIDLRTAAALRETGPTGTLVAIVIVALVLIAPAIAAAAVLLWLWLSRTELKQVGLVAPTNWQGALVLGVLSGVSAKLLLAESVPSLAVTVISRPPLKFAGGVPVKVRVVALKTSQLGKAAPLVSLADRVSVALSTSVKALAGRTKLTAVSSLMLTSA